MHEDESDDEEMNNMMESITAGKITPYKKLQFQAFCAAITHEDQVRFILEYLTSQAGTKNNNAKFATAKNRIYAYRVNQMDPIQ